MPESKAEGIYFKVQEEYRDWGKIKPKTNYTQISWWKQQMVGATVQNRQIPNKQSEGIKKLFLENSNFSTYGMKPEPCVATKAE